MSDSPGGGGGGAADKLLTTGEIAKRLAPWGISRYTVTQMVNNGEFGEAGPRGYRRRHNAWARVPERVIEQYIRDNLPPMPTAGDQPA